MKVLFIDRFNETRFLKEVTTIKEAYDVITQFCEERKFEIRYFRTWEKDGLMTVDIGSHYEVFHIVGIDNEKELQLAKEWFNEETGIDTECLIKLGILKEEKLLEMYRKYGGQ